VEAVHLLVLAALTSNSHYEKLLGFQVADGDLKPQQMFGFSPPTGAKNQTSVPK
jgi:hypothetical protein